MLPGVICPDRKPGTNANASEVGNHLPRILIRKWLKLLKPDGCSNADLIVIKTEEIEVTIILTVQIVHPGTEPPGNEDVKRWLNKPVIVIPCCINIVVSGKVI
jgi:hypothetical protein